MIRQLADFRRALEVVDGELEAQSGPPEERVAHLRAAAHRLAEKLDDTERLARQILPLALPGRVVASQAALAMPAPGYTSERGRAAGARDIAAVAPPPLLSWPPPAGGAPPTLCARGATWGAPARGGASTAGRPRDLPSAPASAAEEAGWQARMLCAQKLTSMATHHAVWSACCADLSLGLPDADGWKNQLSHVLAACFVVQREAEVWADSLELGCLRSLVALRARPKIGRFLFHDLQVSYHVAMASDLAAPLQAFDPHQHGPAISAASDLVLARQCVATMAQLKGERLHRMFRAVFVLAARYPVGLLEAAARTLLYTPEGGALRRGWHQLTRLTPVEEQVAVRLLRPMLVFMGHSPEVAETHAPSRRQDKDATGRQWAAEDLARAPG